MPEFNDDQPAMASKEQEPGFEDIGDLFTSLKWYVVAIFTLSPLCNTNR